MAHVSVIINGRRFSMACEDGQENHLVRLAEDLDQRLTELKAKFGEIGDMRLTVMAALTIADELVEAGQRLRRLEQEVAELQKARAAISDRSQQTQAALAGAFDAAAERIEKVTRILNQSSANGMVLG
ncbi:MAG TPA: cell division protein ZapA [Xanthobacteraceae bacterium]|jgi:cell division protein ZapA|nr:cell division protein ZapA [Xanthobacteraceae bacterium]